VTVHSRTASVGQAAPDFSLDDQHGETFHLEEARARGPVVHGQREACADQARGEVPAELTEPNEADVQETASPRLSTSP